MLEGHYQVLVGQNGVFWSAILSEIGDPDRPIVNGISKKTDLSGFIIEAMMPVQPAP